MQAAADTSMETWIEAFFADTPSLSSSSSDFGRDEELDTSFIAPSATSTSSVDRSGLGIVGKEEAEMQKFFDLLPEVESEGDNIGDQVDVRAALGLDLCGWNFGQDATPALSSVGVF